MTCSSRRAETLRFSASLERLLHVLCELLTDVHSDVQRATAFLNRVNVTAEYMSDLFLVREIAPRVMGLLFADSIAVSVLACRVLLSTLQSVFLVPLPYRRFANEIIYPGLVDISRAEVSWALLATIAEVVPDIQAVLQMQSIVTTFVCNQDKDTILDAIERDSEITAGFVSEIIISLFEHREPNITTALLLQFSRLARLSGIHMALPIAKIHIAPIIYAQVLFKKNDAFALTNAAIEG